jgi:hypothetical protein
MIGDGEQKEAAFTIILLITSYKTDKKIKNA